MKQFTYRAALWGCQFRFLRRLRLQLRAQFEGGKRADVCACWRHIIGLTSRDRIAISQPSTQSDILKPPQRFCGPTMEVSDG